MDDEALRLIGLINLHAAPLPPVSNEQPVADDHAGFHSIRAGMRPSIMPHPGVRSIGVSRIPTNGSAAASLSSVMVMDDSVYHPSEPAGPVRLCDLLQNLISPRTMLNERHSSESPSGSNRPSSEKLKKRRDQNRISQRAFRRRKERHTMELEAKVEELEALLETASRENSLAASRANKMVGELLYYRGQLYGATNQRNSFITSYPCGEYRPGGNQFGTGGDIAAYSTVPAYSYAPSIPSLVAPAVVNEYQRAGSYDSSSTASYSPAGDAPLEYSRSMGDQRLSPPERTADVSMWAYLQLRTSEPVVDDGSYRE